MTDHKGPLQLATAAWIQLHGLTQAYQAAVLRGASKDEIEHIRREAHDVLDSNLDLNGQAAQAVRDLLNNR